MTAWCADCRKEVELNRHGYCGVCGSNALDVAEVFPKPPEKPLPDFVANALTGSGGEHDRRGDAHHNSEA